MTAGLLLQDVHVIDDRGEGSGRQNIEIRQGKIHAILPASQPSGTTDLEVVNCKGSYLLPGLIDLHVHLVWDGSRDPAERLAKERREETLLRAVGHARQTLEAGITTVRDLGSVDDLAIDLADAVERGHILGPRIFASGRTIIMTGGHDSFWGIAVDGTQEVLKATRHQIFRGARVIKTSATGGVYGHRQETVTDEELSYDEIRALVEEAHKRGVPVAAHAIGRKGISNAVAAGVDTIEHGHQLTYLLATELAARNGALVPTLFVYRQISEQPGIPEYAQEKAKAIISEHRQAIQLARMAGVRIGSGTDAGSPLTPHGSLVNEILALVDVGLSPLEALKSATYDAAVILGKGKELGRIEPGFLADLILVAENPLEDLSRLRSVLSVWKEGRLVFSR
jgi:imidazolonepropionase-like amidohydrolase